MINNSLKISLITSILLSTNSFGFNISINKLHNIYIKKVEKNENIELPELFDSDGNDVFVSFDIDKRIFSNDFGGDSTLDKTIKDGVGVFVYNGIKGNEKPVPTSIDIDDEDDELDDPTKVTILANGIVTCNSASPGDILSDDSGNEYLVVDNDKIKDFDDSNFTYSVDDKTFDMSHICTSQVTDMTDLFWSYSDFNEDISNWDVSHVTNMSYMLSDTNFNRDISNWDISNVQNLGSLFYNTPFNQDISNWNTSNVTKMSYMFARSAFNQDISNWDTSNVVNMSGMFYYNHLFNQPLNSWNVSKVTNMFNMFIDSNFNQPLNSWNVSSVVNMASMFNGSSFNQDISGWNVSSVINMASMFKNSDFDQDISSWDVSNVTSYDNFDDNTPDTWTDDEKPIFN